MDRKKENFRGKKGAVEKDIFYYMVIGIAILLIMVLGYIILTGRGRGAIEFINNLLKFRS